MINHGFDTESGVEDEEIKEKVHSDTSLDCVIFIKKKQKHGNITTDDEVATISYTEQSVKDIVNDIVRDVGNRFYEINMSNEEEENIHEEPDIEDCEALKK